MAKTKTKKKSQDFCPPLSVLLFKADMEALKKLSAKIGMHKSVLIRLAVRKAVENKIFDGMIAS